MPTTYQTFPLPYIGDVEKSVEYATRSVVFEAQNKQVQRKSINGLTTWKFTCKGDATEYQTLNNFFDSVNGNAGKFYFYDDLGVQRLVRFSDTKLPFKLIREFKSSSTTHAVVVGFTCDITVELVIDGA